MNIPTSFFHKLQLYSFLLAQCRPFFSLQFCKLVSPLRILRVYLAHAYCYKGRNKAHFSCISRKVGDATKDIGVLPQFRAVRRYRRQRVTTHSSSSKLHSMIFSNKIMSHNTDYVATPPCTHYRSGVGTTDQHKRQCGEVSDKKGPHNTLYRWVLECTPDR